MPGSDSLRRRSSGRLDRWSWAADVFPILDPDEEDWLVLLDQGSRVGLELVEAKRYVSWP